MLGAIPGAPLEGISVNAVNWIVDRFHVSATYAEVEADMLERIALARARGAVVSDTKAREILAQARDRHRDNRAMYRGVMRGVWEAWEDTPRGE